MANQLETTLKHNLDVALQNASLMIGRLHKQFGSNMSIDTLMDLKHNLNTIGKMRESLATVETFDPVKLHPVFGGILKGFGMDNEPTLEEAVLNNQQQSVSIDDTELDVHGIKTLK